MSESELKILLEGKGVSTTEWGKDQAKTLKHLLSEIEAGETVLKSEANGKLIRHTAFLSIQVFYDLYEDEQDGRKRYKLIEDKQVFTDGRERSRNQVWSVAEKLKRNENDIRGAVRRALKEELGVYGEPLFTSEIEVKEENMISPSYPGLKARFLTYNLLVFLGQQQFKAEGYKEVQEDKTTYFKWVTVK